MVRVMVRGCRSKGMHEEAMVSGDADTGVCHAITGDPRKLVRVIDRNYNRNPWLLYFLEDSQPGEWRLCTQKMAMLALGARIVEGEHYYVTGKENKPILSRWVCPN